MKHILGDCANKVLFFLGCHTGRKWSENQFSNGKIKLIKMLCLKKVYRDELLQLAILLSLLRVDRRSSLGYDYDSSAIGVGIDDIQGWEQSHSLVRRDIQIHPKNLDSVLLNYEQQVFDDLNSLGRYNRINSVQDVTAYLLNVDGNNEGNDMSDGNNTDAYDRIEEEVSRTEEGEVASGYDFGEVELNVVPDESESDDPFIGALFGPGELFLKEEEEEELDPGSFLETLATDIKGEPGVGDELTQEVCCTFHLIAYSLNLTTADIERLLVSLDCPQELSTVCK